MYSIVSTQVPCKTTTQESKYNIYINEKKNEM